MDHKILRCKGPVIDRGQDTQILRCMTSWPPELRPLQCAHLVANATTLSMSSSAKAARQCDSDRMAEHRVFGARQAGL